MSVNDDKALPAAQWTQFFSKAQVRTDELTACKGERAQAIFVGKFFTPLIGRRVPIQVKGRTGTAALEMLPGRSNQKRYRFRIRWDSPTAAPASGVCEAGVSPVESHCGAASAGLTDSPLVPTATEPEPAVNLETLVEPLTTQSAPLTMPHMPTTPPTMPTMPATPGTSNNNPGGGGNKEAW